MTLIIFLFCNMHGDKLKQQCSQVIAWQRGRPGKTARTSLHNPHGALPDASTIYCQLRVASLPICTVNFSAGDDQVLSLYMHVINSGKANIKKIECDIHFHNLLSSYFVGR